MTAGSRGREPAPRTAACSGGMPDDRNAKPPVPPAPAGMHLIHAQAYA